MIFIICVIVFSVALITFLARMGIAREKKQFNNGVCPICGRDLHFTYLNSHGERGYRCKVHSYRVWVSWNCVDHYYDKKKGKNK